MWEKLKTKVLKGVTGGYEAKEIREALEEAKIPDVTVKNVVKISRKHNPENPHFIVQITQDSVMANLTKTRAILSQRIFWEKKHAQDVFQCKNCQRVGHGSINCHLTYRCVKCAETHGPGNCKIPANSAKELLKCANCNTTGHVASFRGCPYLLRAIEIRKDFIRRKEEIKKNKNINLSKPKPHMTPNSAYQQVDKTISYANRTNNTTRPEPPKNISQGPPRNGGNIQQHLNQNHNLQHETLDNNELSQINQLYNDIRAQTAILTKMQAILDKLNSKVENNTMKIEFLLSAYSPAD